MGERNVLGGELEPCGNDPVTGFYRNGCCSTGSEDLSSGTICAVVTAEFLAHQRAIGNDPSTNSARAGTARSRQARVATEVGVVPESGGPVPRAAATRDGHAAAVPSRALRIAWPSALATGGGNALPTWRQTEVFRPRNTQLAGNPRGAGRPLGW